jgi:hypothetical protein
MEHAAAVLREHERQYNNYRPAPITPSAPAGRPHSPALRERPFERCDEIGSAASYTSMCGMLLWIVKPRVEDGSGGMRGLRLPPALIVFHRLSVSTSFVLAALRALHVDSSGAVEVMAGTEEGWGLSRAV